MVVGPTTDGLHHPALAEVLAGEAEPHAIGIEGGAAEQIGLPPGVVHHQVGGGVADDDQPVPRAGGPFHRAAVDVAAGHREAAGDMLLDQIEVGALDQPGGDAVVGEGLELGVGVGGVAVALHHRQVLVVAIGTRKRAGLEGLQEHGATGREAGAIALAQLGRIALLGVGHTPQRVGMADYAGPQRGRAAPTTGRWWFGRRGGSAPERRFCLAAPPQPRLAGPAGVYVKQQRRRHLL